MRVLSERICSVLPPDTALTWKTIAPIVPPTAYLGGGTAIAVHLAHRVSRDLDLFFRKHSGLLTGGDSALISRFMGEPRRPAVPALAPRRGGAGVSSAAFAYAVAA